MSTQLLFALLTAAAFSLGLEAAPTYRPLPTGILDGDADFQVLRDHKEARHFYLVPKRLEVYENALQPFGEQKDGCEAVAQFNKAQQTLVETKKEHAETSLRRAKLINELLSNIVRLEKEATEALLKRKQLEEELKAEGLPPEKAAKIQKAIADIERSAALLDAQIKRVEAIQKIAESEQKQLLEQVTKLETSLAKFEERVALPAAKVRLRMRPAALDPKSPEVKKHFGFSDSDQISLTPIVGISYYPGDNESVDFLERRAKATTVGTFTGEWSPKSFVAKEADFGQPELPGGLEQKPFPNGVFFEQLVSLYTYCAIRAAKPTPTEPIVPVRVSFQIVQWAEKGPMKTEPKELLSHGRTLSASAWSVLAALPAAVASPSVAPEDPGAPQLFAGRGVFETKAYNASFQVLNNQKEKE